MCELTMVELTMADNNGPLRITKTYAETKPVRGTFWFCELTMVGESAPKFNLVHTTAATSENGVPSRLPGAYAEQNREEWGCCFAN